MFTYLKFRYSFICFLSLLTVLSLEAPALKSYSADEKTFFMEELEFYWGDDKPGLDTFLEVLYFLSVKNHEDIINTNSKDIPTKKIIIN